MLHGAMDTLRPRRIRLASEGLPDPVSARWPAPSSTGSIACHRTASLQGCGRCEPTVKLNGLILDPVGLLVIQFRTVLDRC